MADDPLFWLEQHATEYGLDLAEFWAGAGVLADCDVIDASVELAKRVKPRIEAGDPFKQAIRTGIDETLAEAPRNSD